MPVVVTMEGALESITLQEGFLETANTLNLSAAQGKQFVVATDEDGSNILVNIHKINTIVETD